MKEMQEINKSPSWNIPNYPIAEILVHEYGLMALFSANHPFEPNYQMGTIGGYFCSVYGCCCGSIQMNGLDCRIMFRVAKIKGRFCLDHALPSLSFLLK